MDWMNTPDDNSIKLDTLKKKNKDLHCKEWYNHKLLGEVWSQKSSLYNIGIKLEISEKG